MANLSVLKFDGPDTADRALLALEGMQQRQLISVLDAAVVSYPEGASKPRTRQLQSTTAAGTLGGMFWGTLLGLIFFVPLLGAAVGAATGAARRRLHRRRHRRRVHPADAREGDAGHLGPVRPDQRRDGRPGGRGAQGVQARGRDHQPLPGAGGQAARGLRRHGLA
jgi:hypothetical protein